MINLIDAELFKIRKIKGQKVLTALIWLLALSPIFMLLFCISTGNVATSTVGDNFGLSEAISTMLLMICFCANFFVIFPVSFAFSGEITKGNARRAVEASHSRSSILTSKIISEYLYSLFLIITTLFIGIVSTVILLQVIGKMNFGNAQMIVIALKALLISFVPVSASLCFLNLAYIVLGKDFLVVITYIIYFSLNQILEFIQMILYKFPTGFIDLIKDYTPSALYSDVIGYLSSVEFNRGLPISTGVYKDILLLTIYIIIFTGLSYFLIRKRDFK